MKKLAIILALMLFQTQIAAVAANANYNKKPAQKHRQTKPVKQKTKTQCLQQDGRVFGEI